MAKRRATTELNRDNWDVEEESEDPGTFTRLGEDELKNRVIRKAKRTLVNKETSGSSPFAAFSGFAKCTPGSNPFNFLKNNVSGEESSSMNVSSSTDNKKENGNMKTNVAEATDEKIEYAKSMAAEKKTSVSEVTDKKQVMDSSTSDKQKQTRSIEYYRQLQSLNESVMKWMQLHLSKNACCDFTPVFNDYKKHLDTLNFTYPIKGKERFVEKSSSQQSSVSTDEDSLPKIQNSTGNHGFKFGKSSQKQQDDETDYGAHFKSNTTNTSTFSFGINKTPTATSTMSSGHPTTSLREEAMQEKKPFQFSFGLKNTQMQNTEDSSGNKPFSFAMAPVDKSADLEHVASEEPEYVPPKNDFVAVQEEDAFYSKRCKLFYKKDDSYVERGIGVLHLKPLNGKTQLLIRADTSLGNILLNIVLSASLPMSKTGKNNVLLLCVPNPPIDAKKADSKEAIPMLIRVKTSDDADELLETLKKHKS